STLGISLFEIPVESGRGIGDRDRVGAPPVMVINQEVVRHLSGRFDPPNPVGRAVGIYLLGYGAIPESRVSVQIVGVIRNKRTGGLHVPAEPVVYVPLAQFPRQDISLVVRTRSDPLGLCPEFEKPFGRSIPTYPGQCKDDGTGEGAERA